MTLSLHTIKPSEGSKKTRKRIGRGLASKGAKSGRGQKGQKSRSGSSGLKKLGIRKLMLATPKLRGFKSPHAKKAPVNIAALALKFKKGEEVNPKILKEKGLITSTKNGVKILGNGDLDFDLKIEGCAVSKTAADKITGAGGSIKA